MHHSGHNSAFPPKKGKRVVAGWMGGPVLLQCYFSYGFSVSVSVTVVIFQLQLQLLFFSFYFYFN